MYLSIYVCTCIHMYIYICNATTMYTSIIEYALPTPLIQCIKRSHTTTCTAVFEYAATLQRTPV